MSLSVMPEDGEAVLVEKKADELQNDVAVADDETTATHQKESITKNL